MIVAVVRDSAHMTVIRWEGGPSTSEQVDSCRSHAGEEGKLRVDELLERIYGTCVPNPGFITARSVLRLAATKAEREPFGPSIRSGNSDDDGSCPPPKRGPVCSGM